MKLSKNFILSSAILSILHLTACSNVPEGFCECLNISKDLNLLSKGMMDGESSQEERARFQKVKEAQQKICSPFSETKGEEMREWVLQCERK